MKVDEKEVLHAWAEKVAESREHMKLREVMYSNSLSGTETWSRVLIVKKKHKWLQKETPGCNQSNQEMQPKTG